MRDRKPYTPEQLEVIDQRIRRTAHPKQRAFVFDDAPRVSLLTGRGAGKTSGELLRMLRRMTHHAGSNCLYIAATRESAERLAWNDLKRIISLSLRLSGAKFNESKLTCSLPNGSTLYLFGCDDKSDIQKLRGITYHEVGIDETASIKKELLEELLVEVIGPRMIGTICLLGTPGKVLQGMFFEATAPAMAGTGHRPWSERHAPEFAGWDKWSSHAWNITDGVDAGIAAMAEIYKAQLAEKKRQGWSDSNPYWLREYMGVWASDDTDNVYRFRPYDEHGQPWNLWDPPRDAAGFAVLPKTFRDWGYCVGMDVGFKDAFALELFAFAYDDPSRTLYHVFEIYKTRQYANSIAKMLLGEDLNHSKYGGIIGHVGWPVVMVGDFAGAGGALLTELGNVYGIKVAEAAKAQKYKENSIELLNSMFHEGQVKVMKGSALAKELTELQWVVDQYGKRAENKGQPNHACDALLYLRDAVAALLPSATAATPPPKQQPHRAPVEDVVPEPEPVYGDADQMYQDEAFGFMPGEW